MTWFNVSLILFLFLAQYSSNAVGVQYSHKIESDTGHDLFGWSLATSSHKVVIGAPGDFKGKGSVTIENGAKLTPMSGHSFGYFVDVNKDFIVVSNGKESPLMVFDAGLPYSLIASISIKGTIMAVRIAEGSNTIAVSRCDPSSCGFVEMYEYDGSASWHHSKSIKFDCHEDGACCCGPLSRMSLAVDDNHLAFGYPLNSPSKHVALNVTIYKREEEDWVLMQTLHAPHDVINFGRYIAMDGERLVVGSEGALHTYSVSSVTGHWVNSGTLARPGSKDSAPIAVHKDILIVPVTDRGLPEVCGVVYKFHPKTQTWEYLAILTSFGQPMKGDEYHHSVSVQDKLVYVARLGDAGAVFVYDLARVFPNNDRYLIREFGYELLSKISC